MIATLAKHRCLCRRCYLPFLLFSVIALSEGENVFRLKNINDAGTFYDNVINRGSNYEGTTVFLEFDLDLTSSGYTVQTPVGKDDAKYFKGTFDGQGHIIEGLKMNTTFQYSGIFGYSKGLTVRNVVIGPASSFTSSYTGSEKVCTGGIVGQCVPYEKPCIIENSVNMANIFFNHDISGGLFIGGIAGSLTGSDNEFPVVRNCANYGSISLTGKAGGPYLGGIVGYLGGSSTANPNLIQNCLNYGSYLSPEMRVGHRT